MGQGIADKLGSCFAVIVSTTRLLYVDSTDVVSSFPLSSLPGLICPPFLLSSEITNFRKVAFIMQLIAAFFLTINNRIHFRIHNYLERKKNN